MFHPPSCRSLAPLFCARLNAEADKAVQDAGNRARMMQSANEPFGGSPDVLAKQFHDD